MTALFDKFSILDPQRELNQVVAELGTNPFDRFSILDPVRYHKQIEAASAQTIFTQFSHDGEFAEGQMETSFGTGGTFKHLIAATLATSSGTKTTVAQRMTAKWTAVATAGRTGV
jgi:hypothetical protein